MPSLAIAVEDSLSEAVARRLVIEIGPNFEVGLVFRRGGFGYLKSNMDKFCQLARTTTVLLLTDLDKGKCAPVLKAQWLGNQPQPNNLLFRVVVREIESWILADHLAMTELLGRKTRLPSDPDSLADAKQALLNLAKKAPREVQNDLLPQKGALSSQGLGYNERLESLVTSIWDPARAAGRSDSLRRTRDRLLALAG
jgi:hypothetical protein